MDWVKVMTFHTCHFCKTKVTQPFVCNVTDIISVNAWRIIPHGKASGDNSGRIY